MHLNLNPRPALIRSKSHVGVRSKTGTLPLRIGTRASPLALVQTRAFIGALSGLCPVLRGLQAFEEHPIRTTGDATQASGQKLADLGGKGLFAKEIHEALLDQRIDLAVHSLKDLETTLPPGVVLACTLKREDARDALILGAKCLDMDVAEPWAALRKNAVIGSASVRRQAQILHARPDLQVVTLRGNVQRRLDVVEQGGCAATLLALAGLRRLGIEVRESCMLDPEIMVPAAGQGIVGITVRADDDELQELLAAIEDPEAKTVSTAERALLAALDGSCRTPIGGYGRVLPGGQLHVTGLVARADGSFLLKGWRRGAATDAARLGAELGASLRADSPSDIFV